MARGKAKEALEQFFRQTAAAWVRAAPIRDVLEALSSVLFDPKTGRSRRSSVPNHVIAVARSARVPIRPSRRLSPAECETIRTRLGSKRGTPEYERARDEICRAFHATRRQVSAAIVAPIAAAARVEKWRATKRAGKKGRHLTNAAKKRG